MGCAPGGSERRPATVAPVTGPSDELLTDPRKRAIRLEIVVVLA
ncbi:MAG: hypothetical protein JWR46_652, partial [Mycobacterium sp.]|nr:hypothetical protein [Mycobacterium sp.]